MPLVNAHARSGGKRPPGMTRAAGPRLWQAPLSLKTTTGVMWVTSHNDDTSHDTDAIREHESWPAFSESPS